MIESIDCGIYPCTDTRHDDELAGKGGISNSAVSPIIRSSGEKCIEIDCNEIV